MTYWPWWLGAGALAALCVGFAWSTGRPLGVSGMLGRVVDLRAELGAERADAALASEAEFDRALLAATADAMGVTVEELVASAAPAPLPPAATRPAAKPPVTAHVVFLAAIAGGGALAAALGPARRALPPAALAVEAHRWVAWSALVAGGVLVGAGTALSGGCSSGHGLSGCARLQPASLAATAAFFGAAAAASWALAALGC